MKYEVRKNGKTIAVFLRRWEAEKFIEISAGHGYTLVERED